MYTVLNEEDLLGGDLNLDGDPKSWSTTQLSVFIRNLGAPYKPYAVKIKEEGVTGASIRDIVNANYDFLEPHLGVKSFLHKRIIKEALEKELSKHEYN